MKELLVELRPDLIREWDFKKNTIDINSVTIGSKKKVWWILSYDDPKTGKHFDFSWDATVQNRVNGRGCPYLNGSKVWKGFNDLETLFPDISLEWHPYKNGKLKPELVTPYSTKKVWWLYPYDDPKTGKHFEFEWESKVVERTSGVKCPYISGRKVWVGYNDLATTNPELAKQWDYNKNSNSPLEITGGSHKKVWWICPYCGNSWKAEVKSRNSGNGCSNCSFENKTSFPEAAIFYYLRSLFKDVEWRSRRFGVEFDIYIEELRLAIEYDGKVWHKNREKDIKKNIFCKDNNIKLIRVREMLPPLNDYSIDILMEKNDYPTIEKMILELTSYISTKQVDVNLKRDEIDIYNLYVAGRKENSLANKYPDLARQWHPTKNGNVSAQMVLCGSQKVAWWIYPYDDPRTGRHFDFEWKATIKNRVKQQGCPYLTGNLVWRGFNDLESCDPELSKQWHPTKNIHLKPHSISKNSNKSVWWIYPYDDPRTGRHFVFEWKASVNNRRKQRGCPFVLNKLVWKGFNDLATVNPQLANQWNYSKNDIGPYDVTYNSNKNVWWIYSYDDPKTGKHFDFEWKASINHRSKHPDCPYIKGKVWKGYNDLETLRKDLVLEWDFSKNNINPDEITVGSSKKVWWKCKRCGHSFECSIKNRVRGAKCNNCFRRSLNNH